jgi:hypothetical protein
VKVEVETFTVSASSGCNRGALNEAADKVAPKDATRLRKAAGLLGGVSREVLVDVAVRAFAAVARNLGLPS